VDDFTFHFSEDPLEVIYEPEETEDNKENERFVVLSLK